MPTIDLGSVVGPQGQQGNTGPAGPQGVAGPSLVSASTQTTLTGVLAGDGSTVGIRAVDATPVANSTNLAQSGGVKTYTDDKVIRIPASGSLTVSTASTAGVIAYSDDSRITGDYHLIHWEIGNIAYQTSAWTVTTTTTPASGSHKLTVSGTCSASTTIVLYLERS